MPTPVASGSMAPTGLLSIAKGLVTKKATYANKPRPEHPFCAMLWHVCTRQPHMFEYVLWALWLLTLAFWVTVFVLIVAELQRFMRSMN